jgi:hypothetical protein
MTAMPLPSSVGREKEGEAPMSPGERAFGSLAWPELEEDEGATLAPADMETKFELLAKPEEARARGDEHLDQVGDPPEPEVSLEGNLERAMVLASRPPESESWPVWEWVQPDPSKLGSARFILCDRQEKEL